MFRVTTHTGTARRAFVPFADSKSRPAFEPARFERSWETTARTERSARATRTRIVNEWRAGIDSACILDTVTSADGNAVTLYMVQRDTRGFAHPVYYFVTVRAHV